ncbi:MAG: FeoB-associated Cys-rich membrane protein [Oscillospiraceae bacterium]|nr:FeoB-associated Cys-rich membrane protein [Oscillospiraceae bacterium]
MIPTLTVALILVMIVALIIRTLINDRKKGKLSCGGNCSSCGACRGCRSFEIHNDKKV